MKSGPQGMVFTFKGFLKYWLKFWKFSLVFFVIGLIAGCVFVFRNNDSYMSSAMISVHNRELSFGDGAVSPYSALSTIFVSSDAVDVIAEHSGERVSLSGVTVIEGPRSVFTISAVGASADEAKRIAGLIVDNADEMIRSVYSDGDNYEVVIIDAPSNAVKTTSDIDKITSIIIGGLAGVLIVAVLVFIRFDNAAAVKVKK